MVEETMTLLDLWSPGMTTSQLYEEALQSGRFPGISARRLLNFVKECFAPRVMLDGNKTLSYLKTLLPKLSLRDTEQLLLIYTCRANAILGDFIREIYWPTYAAGRERITNLESHDFVAQANQQGKTVKPWSETTIKHVASYLTGTCADFGLLERGTISSRKILSCRIGPQVAVVLAYDLHFTGLGDNMVVAHADWSLFGMERADVIAELRRAALKGALLVQAAGDVVRIGWQCKTAEELSSAISES